VPRVTKRLACLSILLVLTACSKKRVETHADSGVQVVVHAVEPQEPPPPPKPRTYNVVLITIDTLRHDLGYAGYPKPITPHLDALAARSAVFERAYATASYTPKSLGPLLIGRYGSETARDYEHYTTFYPKNVFVAERVHAGGGYSFAAMCHHYFRWKTGFDQGFDRFDVSAVAPGAKDNDDSVTSDRLSDTAIALLDDPENVRPERRFFAWFHYLDPHMLYVRHEGAPSFKPAPGQKEHFRRAAYDGEVWFTDEQVGRVLDHIAKKAWAADTVVIVTSDHGEAFGEKDFQGHGRELWEPVVRVPLLIHVPGEKPRQVAVKRSHIDLVPTILDLMGIPVEGEPLRGTSLKADLTSDGPLEERDVYMDMPKGPFNEARRAIIVGPTPGLKLIDFGDDRYELYDLATDPGERRSVIGDAEKRRPAYKRLTQLRATLHEVDPSH
jgi:choline-sulfatase